MEAAARRGGSVVLAYQEVTVGSALGAYTIVERLGAGAMGEVFRGRDSALDRDVAIKILRPEMIDSPTILARFDLEAKALAAISHPNIATIHSIEESDGMRFLVLELVEGQSLAQKLRRGRIPMREALDISLQIADALEAAHRQGIIHRDLKPSNVMITEDRRVKLLDFGIAKVLKNPSAWLTAQSGEEEEVLTATGAAIGTPAYMSPEQLNGDAVDTRSDIWAFGCVLFEVLAHQRAFGGRGFAEMVSNITLSEPNWQRLPDRTPPAIRHLLRRCLDKDPQRRLQHVGDARIELEDTTGGRSLDDENPAPVRKPFRLERWLTVAAILVLAAALVWSLLDPGTENERRERKFDLNAPTPLLSSSPPAVSSDGSFVIYAAADSDGLGSQLYRRSMVTGDVQPLAGTEGASHPFLSPDGEWVAFFADNLLEKLSLQGGDPITVCEARASEEATWTEDGRIYFQPTSAKGIAWVAAAGGPVTEVATPPEAPLGIEAPARFQEGRLLVNVFIGGGEPPIGILSLDSGELTVLPVVGSQPRYLSTGHLVYLHRGALTASRFDPETLELGEPSTIEESVLVFDVSDEGSLILMPGVLSSQRRIVWVERDGTVSPIEDFPSRDYGTFQLSPDGKRLAIQVQSASTDVYMFDLQRGTQTRLTQEGNSGTPSWHPDGRRVSFSSDRGGSVRLYLQPADGSATAEPLGEVPGIPAWGRWSPAGDFFAYTEVSGGLDVWVLPMDGSEPYAFADTALTEWGPSVSPDGKWIAYASDEGGRFEIYAKPLDDSLGDRWTLSTNGGEEPIWTPSGELFYRSVNTWMAMPIDTSPVFEPGEPQVLFSGDFAEVSGVTYDVSPDGNRLLLLEPAEEAKPVTRFEILLDWTRRLP